MNIIKRTYTSLAIIALFAILSPISIVAQPETTDPETTDPKDKKTETSKFSLNLSPKDRDAMTIAAIGGVSILTAFTLISGYIVNKTAQSKTQSIQSLLDDFEISYPYFTQWLTERKNHTCILTAIEEIDPTQLVHDYKSMQNKYNVFMLQYEYLSQVSTTSLATQKKLGNNYQKLKDAMEFCTHFLNDARLKYTEYQIKLLETTAYFLIKDTDINTKAANIFSKFFNVPAGNCTQSMMLLHKYLFDLSTELTAFRNDLHTMKATNEHTKLMNRVELFLYQIDEDFKAMHTQYQLPLPTHLRNALTASNATSADPGIIPGTPNGTTQTSTVANQTTPKPTLMQHIKNFFSRKKTEPITTPQAEPTPQTQNTTMTDPNNQVQTIDPATARKKRLIRIASGCLMTLILTGMTAAAASDGKRGMGPFNFLEKDVHKRWRESGNQYNVNAWEDPYTGKTWEYYELRGMENLF